MPPPNNTRARNTRVFLYGCGIHLNSAGQHPWELERVGWVGRTTLTPAIPTLGRHRSKLHLTPITLPPSALCGA